MGVFAPVIHKEDDSTYARLYCDTCDVDSLKSTNDSLKKSRKTESSCILYGVPKVEYSFEECTPFPTALKACLSYIGQKVDYGYIMAASGAAFRLRWNKEYWDGGNVDIMNIYEDEYESFIRSFKAVNRKYEILKREHHTKEDFIEFIKKEINAGRPVIALGIIGPPEACVITGYRDNGKELLGWNCFQENKEFSQGTKIDDSGYFICNRWWDNEETCAVMSIGESYDYNIDSKSILKNAIDIMTKETISVKNNTRLYAGGGEAYDLWCKSITDQKECDNNNIVPILIERLMCQNDAQTMIGEGRYYASCFIDSIGNNNENVKEECTEVSKCFKAIMQCSFDMNKIKGGFEQTEELLNTFIKPEVRNSIGKLIIKAKEHEYQACKLMKDIYYKLE
ncbi:RNA polymerase subunit sigma-24 [Clostridiaceae bacterium M8S5]|nr:RNA polymerase subunit sigma-24 [Clostridiaceae bacterium M8S5]